MATAAERAFIQHLCVPDSLEQIARESYPEDYLPTESLRPLHLFATDYWFAEPTRGTFPSPDAMRTHFEVILTEHEIDLDIDPEDILSWATDVLDGAWIDRKWQKWTKTFSSDMADVDVLNKKDRLTSAVNELMTMQTELTKAAEMVDVRHAVGRTIGLYEERVQMRLDGRVEGGRTGFEQVDTHMSGVRNSELCIIAAPPKMGKSFFILLCAYACWQAGIPPVVFTLENSVEMSMDRLACLILNVDSRRWQRGEATEDEVQRVRDWQARMAVSEVPFTVLQPEYGQRTAQHMIRQAKALGGVALIDQLTFVEPEPGTERLPRYQQIGHSLHLLKSLISSGNRIPCFLAHQVNREGHKAAEKVGRLEMYHLAESAEVERTADWVLGLWQSRMLREGGRAYIQMLASRREDLVNWEMVWRPWTGQRHIIAEINLEADE